jgi:hypothetical protein
VIDLNFPEIVEALTVLEIGRDSLELNDLSIRESVIAWLDNGDDGNRVGDDGLSRQHEMDCNN